MFDRAFSRPLRKLEIDQVSRFGDLRSAYKGPPEMRKTTNTIGQWECHRFLCGPLGISILLRGFKFSLRRAELLWCARGESHRLTALGQGTRAAQTPLDGQELAVQRGSRPGWGRGQGTGSTCGFGPVVCFD